MTMGQLGQWLDIKDCRGGVGHGFGENRPSIGTDFGFDLFEIVDVFHEIRVNAELRQKIAERIHTGAIQVGRGDDAAAALPRTHQRITHCGHTGAHCNGTDTAFQRSESPFQGIDGGIGHTGVFEAVDVATRERIAASRIAEVECGGSVDWRHGGAAVSQRIVSGVDGLCLETFAHQFSPLPP